MQGTHLRPALEGTKGSDCCMVPGLGDALVMVGLKNVDVDHNEF